MLFRTDLAKKLLQHLWFKFKSIYGLSAIVVTRITTYKWPLVRSIYLESIKQVSFTAKRFIQNDSEQFMRIMPGN